MTQTALNTPVSGQCITGSVYKRKIHAVGKTITQFVDELNNRSLPYCERNVRKKLSDNEPGEPSPEMVAIMVEELGFDYELAYMYLRDNPVAKLILPEKVSKKPLAQVAITLMVVSDMMQSKSKMLLEIATDGVISPDEEEQFDEYMETMDKMMASCLELLFIDGVKYKMKKNGLQMPGHQTKHCNSIP